MGKKGSKLSKDSVVMAALLVDRLELLGGITSKKMFGGHGIFYDGKMFGIVDSKGSCYFKANEMNLIDFAAHRAERHERMPYFSIPEEILNNSKKLLALANKTLETIKSN